MKFGLPSKKMFFSAFNAQHIRTDWKTKRWKQFLDFTGSCKDGKFLNWGENKEGRIHCQEIEVLNMLCEKSEQWRKKLNTKKDSDLPKTLAERVDLSLSHSIGKLVEEIPQNAEQNRDEKDFHRLFRQTQYSSGASLGLTLQHSSSHSTSREL